MKIKRWPIIRHIRWAYHKRRMNKLYELKSKRMAPYELTPDDMKAIAPNSYWKSLGYRSFNRMSDEDFLRAIWRGDA